MEHFYKTVPSLFTWPRFTTWIVEQLPRDEPLKLIEIGVFSGCSLAYLGVEIVNAGLAERTKVVGVDFGNAPEAVLRQFVGMGLDISFQKSISWEGAAAHEDASCDYVMIDAGHDYNSVKKDIAAWRSKVKSGGILAGHDYGTTEMPGVTQAVTEAFEDVEVSRGDRFSGQDGKGPPGNYYPMWWVRIP